MLRSGIINTQRRSKKSLIKSLRGLLLSPGSDLALSIASAILLIFSFPNFNIWPLAWVAVVPLLLATARSHQLTHAFVNGWIAGTVFFYGSCYWATFSMVHYGGLPAPLAYVLLMPAAAVLGIFSGFFTVSLALILRGRQLAWILAAPFFWVAFECLRFIITGQLWNAIGYSQAYVPELIQAARFGGVYAVGFLILAVNASIAYIWMKKSRRASVTSAAVILAVIVAIVILLPPRIDSLMRSNEIDAVLIGVQANVPMGGFRSRAETEALLERHLELSAQGLNEAAQIYAPEKPRVVVWSESPMNFAYTRDSAFRSIVTEFARRHRTSVVFNSLEPAPGSGAYNSAMMIDESGRLITQYDKIQLLPFGEYVPLPQWLPGSGLVSGVVGDFTPGDKYPLLPIGTVQSGIFICFEAAFPEVAREFARQGTDILINISNDGYFGPTPVLKQHLAHVVFRAVEVNRPILRVTNTGLTAYIDDRGTVSDVTAPFQTAVRIWPIARSMNSPTFYTKFGELFAYLCVAITAALLLWARLGKRPERFP